MLQHACGSLATARRWELNKPFLIDDSYEHSVQYKVGHRWFAISLLPCLIAHAQHGTAPRLVLIVDLYHPGLTAAERQALQR